MRAAKWSFVAPVRQDRLMINGIAKNFGRRKKMPPRGCRVGRDSFRAGKVGTHTVAARIIIAQTADQKKSNTKKCLHVEAFFLICGPTNQKSGGRYQQFTPIRISRLIVNYSGGFLQENRSFPASHCVPHREHDEVYVAGSDCQVNS